MTSTLVVLVLTPILQTLIRLVLFVACSFIAKKNGQTLKSMSVNLRSGLTVEFFPAENPGAYKAQTKRAR